MQAEGATLAGLRAFLLLLFVLASGGIGAELVLAGHTEDALQYIPLVLLAVAMAWLGITLCVPGRAAMTGLRVLMLLLMLSGLTGLGLHYRGNTEFVLESNPSLSGLRLFWKAIRGTAPPTLAPAAMIALGMVGWAWTYRHPAWDTGSRPADREA
jgi:hypothetical protein